jgi:sigma-B regulation protein RsbU (phosphoserine phosphatase)
VLSNYEYFIPIYHKNKALAYALIGEFNTSGEMLNNDLTFIQTLINVIVVALENKSFSANGYRPNVFSARWSWP